MSHEDTRRAIQARLLADSGGGAGTLATLGLSRYRGGLAVFAQDRVPEDVATPWINVAAPFGQLDMDTKTRNGAREEIDVQVVDAEGPGVAPARIDRLARRAHALLHRGALEVTGMRSVLLRAGRPMGGEAGDGFAARVIGCSAFTQEGIS